jgi:dTDP-4-amino-4,6-dideoxygalactose transaminase
MGHQLPVYSPLSLAALRRGLSSALDPSDSTTRLLRHRLKTRYESQDAVLLDSGTTALSIALEACCAGRPGGGVAIPAYSCYDIVTAVNAAGVDVHLYDIDPRTLSPDLPSVEQGLRRGARSMLIAHLFGMPVDLGPVRALCNRYDAILIEDAAQGMGASYDGRPLGSHGDLAVLSFGRGKGTTGGGGGALLIRAGEMAERVSSILRRRVADGRTGWKTLALAAIQWSIGRPSLYGIPAALPFVRLGETIYRDSWPARGIASASVGILAVAADLAEKEVATRVANAERLRAGLRKRTDVTLIEPLPHGAPSYLRSPVILRVGDLLGRTLRRQGIARGYPKPLHSLSQLASRWLNRDAVLVGAEQLADRLYTLPTHSYVTEPELSRLGQLPDL